MTQEQALKELEVIYPELAGFLTVTRERSIGLHWGSDNEYRAWNHKNRECSILATSDRSWEHMLAIAKSGNENIWPEDKAPWEDEIESQVSA
jgi:hypothetical protein